MLVVNHEVDFSVVFDLSRPLPADQQAAYVADVVARLETTPALGAGLVHRVAAEVFATYFRPPPDARMGSANSRRRAPLDEDAA